MYKIRKKRRWPAWVLSVLIVLGLFPADVFAAETENTEHVHTEECYEMVLTCLEAESEEHIHVEDCWQSEQILACEEDHEHAEECYEEEKTLICELDEGTDVHEHTEECYENILVCGLEEEPVSEDAPSQEELTEAQKLTQAIRLFLEQYDPQQQYGEEELAQLRQDQEDIQTGYEALDEESRQMVEGYDEFLAVLSAFDLSADEEVVEEVTEVSPAVQQLNEAIERFLAEFDPEKEYTEEEQAALIESLEAIVESYEALSEEEKAQVVGIEELSSLVQDGGGGAFQRRRRGCY